MTWAGVAIGGASLVGSIYAAHKSSKQQDAAAQQQQQLIDLQKQQAGMLAPYGVDFLNQAKAAYAPLLPYYTKLATGDRNSLLNTLAPELNQIGQNYDRPLQYLTEVSPRGAATTANRMAILSGRANALNNTLYAGRMSGVQGLQGLAGQYAQLGLGASGSALGGLSGASGANLGLLNSLFNIRGQNYGESSDLGSALVDFFKQYQQTRAAQPGQLPTNGPATTGSYPSLTPGPYGPPTGYPMGGHG